ncbi:helix-turn-helix domain-containing protein [Paenibacillus sp. IHBB 10380]|uniref:helix-turn-helix domain-containing protein n=1 Tax=Paenibacillus sp. IHBB 10380 TaxID=1566358 RepID=UPI0005CFD57B|nr:helix-turn-helix domain-containing protein [Paenibacillus sp. IHBB 10380]
MYYTEFNSIAASVHAFYVPIQAIRLSEEYLLSMKDEELHHHAIIVIWGGSGFLKANHTEYELNRGKVFFLGSTSRISISSTSRLEGLLLHYKCLSREDSPLQEPFLPNSVLEHCPDKIMILADQLHGAWVEQQMDNPFQLQQLFTALMAELHSEMKARQNLESSWLERALAYIDNHFCEELTREHLARLAGVSPEHFSRSFRKSTGQTFNEYITLLRIRSAQQQLLTRTTDLNTLALNVGYKEGTYLSRKFKQLVGLSPTIYHRKTKRVVSMTFNHTAALWTLGVVPELGMYSSWLQSVKNVTFDQNMEPYRKSASMIYDAIAAAEPDVIINYNTLEENRPLISLAPIIELPFMTMDWREQFRIIADVVDKRGQAEEWLAHYAKKINEVNTQLDHYIGPRGTAIVWEIGSGVAYCFSSSYGRGCHILYEDLGFHLPAALLEEDILHLGYIETPIETMASYSADHIFIVSTPSEPTQITRMHRLFQSEAWLSLEAVRLNRVYLLDQTDLFYGFDPLSSQVQLRELSRVLTS